MTALIQAKIESTGNPVARDALDQLKTFLIAERRESLVRACEKLSRYDLIDFISRSQVLLFSAGRNGAEKNLSVRIGDAVEDWLRALDAAKEAVEPQRVHRLRIAGKRLRYSIELQADLGDANAKSQTRALKQLQDQLGDWHDRVLLLETAADFLARKDFLSSHPDLSRALLVEMERERRKNESALGSVLKAAEKIQGLRPENTPHSPK
jgi:CHAD domain-containing protein